jgi:hypothetical protein
VYPAIGDVAINRIDNAMVQGVLAAIWKTKTVTSTRVRGRIEAILDSAKVAGLRSGENPARWSGYLKHYFPAPKKRKDVDHFAAIPYQALPAFMAELRKQEGIAARALEFAILTAARSGWRASVRRPSAWPRGWEIGGVVVWPPAAARPTPSHHTRPERRSVVGPRVSCFQVTNSSIGRSRGILQRM